MQDVICSSVKIRPGGKLVPGAGAVAVAVPQTAAAETVVGAAPSFTTLATADASMALLLVPASATSGLELAALFTTGAALHGCGSHGESPGTAAAEVAVCLGWLAAADDWAPVLWEMAFRDAWRLSSACVAEGYATSEEMASQA